MKTIKFYVLLIIFSTIAVTATAQKRNKKLYALEITSAALLNDQPTSGYAISVYLDGSKMDSVFNTGKKPVTFYVAYNRLYTFLFQKEGCKDKIVIVNTDLPEGIKYMKEDNFDFEVEMSQMLSKNTVELEDYPVAVLMINKKDELMEASASYNKFTHSAPDVIKTRIEDKPSKH